MKKTGVFTRFLLLLWSLGSVHAYADSYNNANVQFDDLKIGIPNLDLIYWLENDKEIIVNQTDERSKIFGVEISKKCRLIIKLEGNLDLFKIYLQDMKGNDLKKSESVFSFDGKERYLGESILFSASAGKYLIKIALNDKKDLLQLPQTYKFIVIPDISEPNGLRSNAVPLIITKDFPIIHKYSVIDSKGDVDWYKVEITGNAHEKSFFAINLPPADGRSEDVLKWRLENDKQETIIEQSDYEGWFDTTLTSGVYYIRVARNDLQITRKTYRRYEIHVWCLPASVLYSYMSNFSGDELAKNSIPPIITKKDVLSNASNPFNPETDVAYEVFESGNVVLSVLNTKGKKVIELVNGNKAAGSHSVHWNGKDSRGKDMPSGVYYAVLEVNGKRFTKKMVMLK